MVVEQIKIIIIESTSYCNSKCPHCPRFDTDGNLEQNLTLAHLTPDILKNLDPQKLTNLRAVVFEGDKGDPIMNPHLPELLEFFNFVPEVVVFTNGGAQSTQWWQRLALFKNLKVVWSIDGLEDTNHLYRVNVSYRRVINNAQSFIKAGGQAFWKCLLFKHNEHQINDIVKTARDLGFADVQFRTADADRFLGLPEWDVKIKGKKIHTIRPTSFDNRQILQAGAKIESYHSYGQIKSLTERPDTVKNEICPWTKNRTVYIDYQGHVLPCCMMHFETINNYPGREHLKELCNGSFDNINLYHYNLEYIISESGFFNNLEDSLKTDQTRHTVCIKCCFPTTKQNEK